MTPYFRIYTTPVKPTPGLLDCKDNFYQKKLMNPPRTRPNGWTLWSAREIKQTVEGLETIGIGDRRLFLFTNGHLEFWMPCLDETFQWGQANSEKALHPWLYSYAVCELPVNFVMLAKEVYYHANLTQDILAGEAFYSIQGFILMPFGPRTIEYHEPMERCVKPYASDDLKIKPVVASPGFVPDELAFKMVEQVYNAFGYSRQHMRLFDDDHRFIEA